MSQFTNHFKDVHSLHWAHAQLHAIVCAKPWPRAPSTLRHLWKHSRLPIHRSLDQRTLRNPRKWWRFLLTVLSDLGRASQKVPLTRTAFSHHCRIATGHIRLCWNPTNIRRRDSQQSKSNGAKKYSVGATLYGVPPSSSATQYSQTETPNNERSSIIFYDVPEFSDPSPQIRDQHNLEAIINKYLEV